MFEILQKVVFKHLGLEDIVEHVLAQMGKVQQIHLIGDYVKGLDTGTIEVMVVGKKLNTDYITSLEDKVEKLIERKLNIYITNKPISIQENIILYKDESQ